MKCDESDKINCDIIVKELLKEKKQEGRTDFSCGQGKYRHICK